MNSKNLELKCEYLKYFNALRKISECCVSVSKCDISLDIFFCTVKNYIETLNSLFYIPIYTEKDILCDVSNVSKRVNEVKNIITETDRLNKVISCIYNLVDIDVNLYTDYQLIENIEYIRRHLRDIM